MQPEEQFILQNIMNELTAIRAEQAKQGREIERLRTLAMVAGAIGGFLMTGGQWVIRKMAGNG